MNSDAVKAKALFKHLFEKAAQDPGPSLPAYFVTRETFHRECRKAGLPVPAEWVAAVAWEERIGMPEYSHRLIAAYHRTHGSDFTPMEKGAWKLRLQMKRQCEKG